MEQKFHDLRQLEQSAQQAANTETKSSAGDKYETGRAMMHLEKERLAGQMNEVSKLRKPLEMINPEKLLSEIGLGSIVYTDQRNYFISVSLGEMAVENEVFYCVSPVTPIARSMMNKKTGDQISFANQTFKVQDTF